MGLQRRTANDPNGDVRLPVLARVAGLDRRAFLHSAGGAGAVLATLNLAACSSSDRSRAEFFAQHDIPITLPNNVWTPIPLALNQSNTGGMHNLNKSGTDSRGRIGRPRVATKDDHGSRAQPGFAPTVAL